MPISVGTNVLIFMIFQSESDQCLGCVDDIVAAVGHCKEAQNNTLECVEYALGAAVECIECICDIIDIIDGGDGICPH